MIKDQGSFSLVVWVLSGENFDVGHPRLFAWLDHVINFGKHENTSLLKSFLRTSWKSILTWASSAVYLKSSNCKGRWKLEAFEWENNFYHPVTLTWFSTQILVVSKFSKPSWNISLSITGFKSPFNPQQAIWALKWVSKIFSDSLKILEFTRICMENPRGGWGTWVFFGWVCAARDSKLTPRFKKNSAKIDTPF